MKLEKSVSVDWSVEKNDKLETEKKKCEEDITTEDNNKITCEDIMTVEDIMDKSFEEENILEEDKSQCSVSESVSLSVTYEVMNTLTHTLSDGTHSESDKKTVSDTLDEISRPQKKSNDIFDFMMKTRDRQFEKKVFGEI